MNTDYEDLLLVGDLRNDDELPGAFDLQIDSELLSIHTGGGGMFHRLVFFREKDVKELYRQLHRLFGDERPDSEFAEECRDEGFEEAIVSGLEKPLCPECKEPMEWDGSSLTMAKCIHCRSEYSVRKNTRLFVQEVEK